MKVAVFGLGYVGFTVACCIASGGHEVVGVDISDQKVDELNAGIAPFEEPGLHALMKTEMAAGRLTATRDSAAALQSADLALVCVGTPSLANGAHDMRYIVEVSRKIALAVKETKTSSLTIAYRSTMRPGSMRNLVSPIFERALGADWGERIELVYNPEFLREAMAIQDYFHPSKIVMGTRDGKPCAALVKLNEAINAPTFVTSYEEAEITKFIDNSWHAVKVAFANEIGRICQSMLISAKNVHEVFIADTKLNISPYYTRPGGAFGGSCLPKDVRALQYIAKDVGAHAHLIDSLLNTNNAHKRYQVEQILKRLPNARARVLMAGLAFKANTDDLRESPNVEIARELLESGVELRVFDPALAPERLQGQNLGYAYTSLPTIDQLLISRPEAEAVEWDLVIVSNSTGNELDLKDRNVYRTDRID